MPELRRDVVTGVWVIVSPERQVRPQYFKSVGSDGLLPGDCPFCAGNEKMTPPEIYALRGNGSLANLPGWQLRVIPNKYPALRVEGQLNRRGEGFYDKMNGIGAHEVVIETPFHQIGLDELPVAAVTDILRTFKYRLADLKQDFRFKYIQVFKNCGDKAGATIPHPHSQIVALPVVPEAINDRLNRAQDHFYVKERCIYCDILNQELDYGRRVLCENSDYVVFAPFAATFPFQLMIYPRRHCAAYEATDELRLHLLAEILQDGLTRLNRVLNRPAYNLLLHNNPFDRDATSYFHWHIELVPVISGTGGFELATQSYINAIPPEEAVEILKKQ